MARKWQRRRNLLVGSGIGMVVLALGSVAFACTSFRGSQVVQWVTGGTGGGAVTAFGGDGYGSSMGYCPGAGLTTNYPVGMVTLDHTAANATIHVSLVPWVCTSGTLVQTNPVFTHVSDDWYDVNIYGANAFSSYAEPGTQSGIAYIDAGNGQFVGDCMDKNGKPQDGQLLGSFSVANGLGGGDFHVPASDLTTNSTSRFGNLCVTEVTGAHIGGPQVPVRIV